MNKYLYVNQQQNAIILIGTRSLVDHPMAQGCEEVIVPETFDHMTSYTVENGELRSREMTYQELMNALTYVERRYAEYPPFSDFADAWVKNDYDALEDYRQKCLAVKAKYPKP